MIFYFLVGCIDYLFQYWNRFVHQIGNVAIIHQGYLIPYLMIMIEIGKFEGTEGLCGNVELRMERIVVRPLEQIVFLCRRKESYQFLIGVDIHNLRQIGFFIAGNVH